LDEGVALVSDVEDMPTEGIDSTEEGSASTHVAINTEQVSVREQMKVVATRICLFISFFQLCYKVSERRISLLLSFIRGIIFWLSSVGHTATTEFLTLRDMLPKNVYFLHPIPSSQHT
jgi:hypothetical protein